MAGPSKDGAMQRAWVDAVQGAVPSNAKGGSFKCHICLDVMPSSEGIQMSKSADHFCTLCIREYLAHFVAERKPLPVPCPMTKEPMENARCLEVLAGHEARDGFAELVAHCAHRRLRYCSNERCGAPFDWEEMPDALNACVQCPLCWKLTCAECRAPWHEEWSCEEAKRIRADASAVGNLARKNRWMPCPKCHSIVEKTEGCNHVICYCGQEFCYQCGNAYEHFGRGCECGLTDDESPEPDHVLQRLRAAITAANLAGGSENDSPVRYSLQQVQAASADGMINGEVDMTDSALLRMRRLPHGHAIFENLLRNKCPYDSCGRKFKSREAVEQHLRNVRSHPVWICCGQLFRNAAEYASHRIEIDSHFEYKNLRKVPNASKLPGTSRLARKGGNLIHEDDLDNSWDDGDDRFDEYDDFR